MESCFAHSIPGRPVSEWEPMADHEQAVTDLCRRFLIRISPELGDWAAPLGCWHDLGKYQADFQEKIRRDDPRSKAVEHSGIGAAEAGLTGSPGGLAVAFAIAGHHAGPVGNLWFEVVGSRSPWDFQRIVSAQLDGLASSGILYTSLPRTDVRQIGEYRLWSLDCGVRNGVLRA
jgi:hypothetical protein